MASARGATVAIVADALAEMKSATEADPSVAITFTAITSRKESKSLLKVSTFQF